MIFPKRLKYALKKTKDDWFAMQTLLFFSLFLALSFLSLSLGDYRNFFGCLIVVVGMGLLTLSSAIFYYKEFNDGAASSH